MHDLTLQGFPDERKKIPDVAKPYFNIRNYLSTEDGLVLFNGRIIVPTAQRVEVLKELHAAH